MRWAACVVLLAACHPADGVAPRPEVPDFAASIVVVDGRLYADGTVGVGGAVGIALPAGEGQVDAALVYEAALEGPQPRVLAGFYGAALDALGLITGSLPPGPCALPRPEAALGWSPGEAAWAPVADLAVFELVTVARAGGCAP